MKDIQDEFGEIALRLVSDIRNELTSSEAIQALYAKLIWAYYLGKGEEVPFVSLSKEDRKNNMWLR